MPLHRVGGRTPLFLRRSEPCSLMDVTRVGNAAARTRGGTGVRNPAFSNDDVHRCSGRAARRRPAREANVGQARHSEQEERLEHPAPQGNFPTRKTKEKASTAAAKPDCRAKTPHFWLTTTHGTVIVIAYVKIRIAGARPVRARAHKRTYGPNHAWRPDRLATRPTR